MTTDVITSASYNEIPSSEQINSRNLNQVIKFTTVLSSPIITFLVGGSLGFDSFESILEHKFEGDLLNALEKDDTKALDGYSFTKTSQVPIGDYVKSARDKAPALKLVPASSLTASVSDKLLSVTENGAYLCQSDVTLFNPRTREILTVDQTAYDNNNIVVTRGSRGTPIGTIETTDVLLVTGIALDLYTQNVTTTKPIPKRTTSLYNGFRRLFTPGTPVTNTLREESLLYNGQFLEFINEDHKRAHKSQLINTLIYEENGDITSSNLSNPLSNINKFNGYLYWARQNPVTAGLLDLGALTTAKFESLMTWWETYDGLGLSSKPMVYICGSIAYKALQPFLKAGVLVSYDEGFTPSTMGNRVKRYITDSGKIVYICVFEH